MKSIIAISDDRRSESAAADRQCIVAHAVCHYQGIPHIVFYAPVPVVAEECIKNLRSE